MATIKEDYVSFETAKLLKENGFDGECRNYYSTEGHFYSEDFKSNWNCVGGTIIIFSAPTLQMVMKWLREVHNINISVVPHSYKEGKPFNYEFAYWNGGEYHTPYDEKHPIYHELFGKTWKKYEKACEAAIKYCLENLI